MSHDMHSPYAPPTTPGSVETNTPGLIGFILSLCGLACGVMFPVGFIVSLFGLGKEPKGFAIAGTIIGAVGSLLILAVLLLYGAMFAACIGFGATAARFTIETQTAFDDAKATIDEYEMANGELPDEETGNQLIADADIKDGWGRNVRYETTEEGDYVIRSAGADGDFDTIDDATSQDYDWEASDFEDEFEDMDVEDSATDYSPIEVGPEDPEADGATEAASPIGIDD